MNRVTSACIHCAAKFSVPANLVGRPVTCPKCNRQTVVPEDDGDTSYELNSGKTKLAPRDEDPSTWWPDGVAEKLPNTTRAALKLARPFVDERRWKKALGILGPVFQNAGERESRVLRRPVAHCTTGVAKRELERLKESGETISDGFRAVLKKAADLHKYGGTFDSHECGACGRQMRTLEGALKVRTAAGKVYLCCTGPTKNDVALVQVVDLIWQLLTVAARIDPDAREALAVRDRLPWWYRVLVTNEFESGWCTRVIGETPRPDYWALCGSLIARGATGGICSALMG